MNRILTSFLREEKNPYTDRFPAEEIDLKIEGGALAGEVEVRGAIEKSPSHLALNGTLAFRAEFECARCLKSFVRDFRTPIRCRYEQVDELRPGWEVDPDMRYIPSSAKELDILPEIREEIIFAVPLVSLCREDCPGLCPQCGADLSLGPCGCSDRSGKRDTPWEALKKLKT